jgi:hypothetical protein
MDFLWRHKGALLLLLLIAGYLYLNPADKFGFVAENIIIYDRVPIPFFDLYITPTGRRVLFEDLNRPEDHRTLCDSLVHLQSSRGGKPVTLLVGQGFGPEPTLSMTGEGRCAGIPYSVRVKQFPTKAAVRRYNELREKGQAVAIILRAKD